MTHPEIDLQTVNEWQDIADLVTEISGATCALIMRLNDSSMEVFTGSSNEDSPCKPGVTVPLGTGLYSETVVNEQTPLHVSNGRDDPRWNECLDLELGLTFYYGVPINWPDGKPFGAFCIMDRHERTASDTERKLIYRFSKGMETRLSLLYTKELMQENVVNDYLTKIPNRHFFLTQMHREFSRAKRYGQPLCLTLLDLDQLTEVNEQQGIDIGDQTLTFFANMLEKVIRDSDLVARMSGGAFALLTPGTKLDQAIQLIERFRQIIQDQQQNCPIPNLQFSAGVTELGVADTTHEELIRRTDNTLRMAKTRGSNGTCY